MITLQGLYHNGDENWNKESFSTQIKKKKQN